MEYAILGLVVVFLGAAIYVGRLQAKAARVDQAEAERDQLQDQVNELAQKDQSIARANAADLWMQLHPDGPPYSQD